MRRAFAALTIAASLSAGAASAQTYGQPYYAQPSRTYGQPVSQPYGDPRAYHAPGGYGSNYGSSAGYGDPYAYRAPYRPTYRYGYASSNQWTRWSSPPGRGYHDVYGYNDDRAPRGGDYRARPYNEYGSVGAYLYDR